MRKKLASLCTVVGVLLSTSVFAERYPSYPDIDPRTHFRANIERNIETVIGSCNIDDSKEIQQSLYFNIPGFYLKLENRLNNQVCSSQSFPIRVGRHWEKHVGKKVSPRLETPVGKGIVRSKDFHAVFYYSSPGKRCFKTNWRHRCVKRRFYKKGEIIETSRTYTPEGKFVIIDMPYKWMRSLHLTITPEGSKRGITRCTIHGTTDTHTIGTPASHCCIGLSVGDMLDLYGLVVPQKRNGKLARLIPIEFDYNLVERNGREIILHADIYQKGIEYAPLVRRELTALGLDNVEDEFIDSIVDAAKEQFNPAYMMIRKKLALGKFISRKEADKLHYRFNVDKLPP